MALYCTQMTVPQTRSFRSPVKILDISYCYRVLRFLFFSVYTAQKTVAIFFRFAIILFLTVLENKIAATPENIGVVAILTVVSNYSILFSSFTFLLDGFHLAFRNKFEVCIKTTNLM